MTGAELLAVVQERHPGLPMVMMTAYGTVEDAVAAMKAGARDFLTKPFAPSDLVHLVRNVLRDPEGDRPAIAAGGARAVASGRIVTRAPALQRVLAVAAGVAGEPRPGPHRGGERHRQGARRALLHAAGRGARRPFVAVNCAALPRELLESELFGHERGAFTGAAARKLGKFELANGGTLFLDEIGEMAPDLQAKLLRVLQEREVDRVGGGAPGADRRARRSRRRTGRSRADGRARAFRDDLYYRLNVDPDRAAAAARARRDDIDALVDHFLPRASPGRPLGRRQAARRRRGRTRVLERRPWPGNVRELEHVIERAVLLATRRRDRAPPTCRSTRSRSPKPSPSGSLAGLTVHEVERRLIVETLRRTNNNRSHAAEMLGISVRTLRNKLAEYRTGGPAVGAA